MNLYNQLPENIQDRLNKRKQSSQAEFEELVRTGWVFTS